MEKLIMLFTLVVAVSLPAYAWNPLETTKQAKQRHSAERYKTYRDNGYQAPLGGYKEKLGDPAPYGTEKPGYTQPNGYGYGSPYGGSNQNNNDRW